MDDKDFYNKLKSPIPPHLTPEEREEWEKELEWERKELERRRREGRYRKHKKKRSILGSLFDKLKLF